MHLVKLVKFNTSGKLAPHVNVGARSFMTDATFGACLLVTCTCTSLIPNWITYKFCRKSLYVHAQV